jgi:hypothetical protein
MHKCGGGKFVTGFSATPKPDVQNPTIAPVLTFLVASGRPADRIVAYLRNVRRMR